MIIQIFISAYILILCAGTIFLMVYGYNFLDSAFQMASGLGTVGLSTIPIHSMAILPKIVLMLAMLFGRLEIFPLLVLFRGILMRRQ